MSDTAKAPHRAADLSARDRRDFRFYLSSEVSTTFGTVFTRVAVSALAVDLFHISGFQAGLLSAGTSLSALLVAPLSGLAADRTRRPRRILILAELMSAAIVGLCALGLATGIATFGWLLFLTVILGGLSAVTQTVFMTHLNSLRTQQLSVARARLQSASYLASLAGNAAAGPLISVLGPVVALVADAGSYLGSAGALKSIGAADQNPAREDGPASAPVHHGVVDGFRVLTLKKLRSVAIYSLIAQTAFAGMGALKALFILQTLNLPLYLYSIPGFAAAGLGAVGSILASRALQAGRRPDRLAAWWWAVGAVGALVIPVAGGSTAMAVTVVSVGIAVPVMCYSAANIAVVALFSEEIPEATLGRVSAAIMVVSTASIALGAMLAGLAADQIGVRGSMWACAGIGVAGVALLYPLLLGSGSGSGRGNGRGNGPGGTVSA